MREVSEHELRSIKRQGGTVTRKNRPMPKRDPRPAPAPEPVPPPAPTQSVPLPQQPAEVSPKYDPQVATLVEAQAQLMAHNSAMIQNFGEQLKAIATSRTPVPWKMIVNRSKKGFIADIDMIPQISGA